MPTLLAQEGFKFFFYANEHMPLHVHVTRGGGYAKIDLATLAVSDRHLRPADASRAVAIAREHQAEFIRRWYEFFPSR
ncbi:MAG: DUF4160 domain-containing protein [Myxococcota bacterium]